MAPVMQAFSFPLQGVNQPISGTVSVATLPGAYTVRVQAAGMAPGSVHSVHLHFGGCPSAGIHILVLGSLNANSAGAAVLVATLRGTYMGDGRFVIIYVGPGAGPLGACAGLMGHG
jgi:hypothetical protein